MKMKRVGILASYRAAKLKTMKIHHEIVEFHGVFVIIGQCLNATR